MAEKKEPPTWKELQVEIAKSQLHIKHCCDKIRGYALEPDKDYFSSLFGNSQMPNSIFDFFRK